MSAERGLLQMLPGGGPIDAMLSGRAARVQRERFEVFALEVYGELQELDDAKVDWTFFNSQDGYDYFASVAEQVVRTSDTAKLRALRTAFVNGVSQDHSRDELKAVVVRMVGQMTGLHVQFLREAGEFEHTPMAAQDPDGEIVVIELRTALAHWDPEQFDAIVTDLSNMGVLASWWQSGTYGALEGRSDSLMFTALGRRIMTFLRDPRA